MWWFQGYMSSCTQWGKPIKMFLPVIFPISHRLLVLLLVLLLAQTYTVQYRVYQQEPIFKSLYFFKYWTFLVNFKIRSRILPAKVHKCSGHMRYVRTIIKLCLYVMSRSEVTTATGVVTLPIPATTWTSRILFLATCLSYWWWIAVN